MAALECTRIETEKDMDLPPSEQMMLMVLPDMEAVTVGLEGFGPSSRSWNCARISSRLQAHSSLD